MRTALRSDGMNVGEAIVAQSQAVEGKEDDLSALLRAIVPDGMAPHGAALHLSAQRLVEHTLAQVEALLVDGIEMTAASVEAHRLGVAAKGRHGHVGHMIVQFITHVEAWLVAEEVTTVSEYQEPLTHVELHRKTAADEVEAQDAVEGLAVEGATLQRGLTARQGDVAERHRRHTEDADRVGPPDGVVCQHEASLSAEAAEGRILIDDGLAGPRVEQKAIRATADADGHIDLLPLPLYRDGIGKI